MVVVVGWEAHDVTLGNENMRGGRVRSRRYINYNPLLSSFLGVLCTFIQVISYKYLKFI